MVCEGERKEMSKKYSNMRYITVIWVNKMRKMPKWIKCWQSYVKKTKEWGGKLTAMTQNMTLKCSTDMLYHDGVVLRRQKPPCTLCINQIHFIQSPILIYSVWNEFNTFAYYVNLTIFEQRWYIIKWINVWNRFWFGKKTSPLCHQP